MAWTKAQAEDKMKKTVQALRDEFKTVRTGRASAALFDRVMVSAYGTATPLSQVATISVPEARLVVIQPWDRSLLTDIEKAIQKSDLSVNPNTVVRAYRELEIRGVLTTQQGLGTFITREPVPPDEAARQRQLDQLVSDVLARAGAVGVTADELLTRLQDFIANQRRNS